MTQSQISKHLTANKQAIAEAASNQDLPSLYATIKPALEFISTFPLIPAKIRKALRVLMSLLDLQAAGNAVKEI